MVKGAQEIFFDFFWEGESRYNFFCGATEKHLPQVRLGESDTEMKVWLTSPLHFQLFLLLKPTG